MNKKLQFNEDDSGYSNILSGQPNKGQGGFHPNKASFGTISDIDQNQSNQGNSLIKDNKFSSYDQKNILPQQFYNHLQAPSENEQVPASESQQYSDNFEVQNSNHRDDQ